MKKKNKIRKVKNKLIDPLGDLKNEENYEELKNEAYTNMRDEIDSYKNGYIDGLLYIIKEFLKK